MALDPAKLHRTAYGITLDTPYRLQRIGYPVLAWLAAAGRPGLVPWSLVGINVAALGALGFLGGVLARDAGRHALGGVLLAGYWGFPFSVSWDLSGISALALVVAGLLALRRDRIGWGACALTAAVLTKETALVAVAGVALAEAHRFWSSRHPELARQLSWAVPVLAFTGWQLVIRSMGDGAGMRADAGANLGRPLVAVLAEIDRDLRSLGSVVSLVDLAQILLLLGLAGLALTTLRTSTAPLRERMALVGMTVVVLCLSGAVWSGQKDLRSLGELYALAVIVLSGSGRRLRSPALLVAYVWSIVVAIQLSFF